MSHGIAGSHKSCRDNSSRFRSSNALATLVNLVIVLRVVTITSAEPNSIITFVVSCSAAIMLLWCAVSSLCY